MSDPSREEQHRQILDQIKRNRGIEYQEEIPWHRNSEKGLVERFSSKEVEIAQQIGNDIAEFIDNGHTREELQMAVAYYNDLYVVECQKRVEQKSDVMSGMLEILSKLDKISPV